MDIKNNGLDLEREARELSPEDWKFGATSIHCIAEIPHEERFKYLPEGELQFTNIEDMMDCATRAPINILETKFTYLLQKGLLSAANMSWLAKNEYIVNDRVKFSDAFVAINSGTSRSGNSLKAPLQAIHEFGLIPKAAMPLEEWMTWDDYHNPDRVTNQLISLGQAFLRRFSINYEIVSGQNFENGLAGDLLDVAAFAWPDPVNGIYPRVPYQPNHAFVVFGSKWLAFDNYLDTDKDFVKRLAEDYSFLHYGYRLFISAQNQPKQSWIREFLGKILSFLSLI